MYTSVIISTYNGEKKLPGLLNSLENQSFKDFELIIVVDGSADNTMKVLDKWKARFTDCKIIYQENKGRAAVRNTGIKNALGQLAIFLDDDIIADTYCIQNHINGKRDH